MFAGGAPGEGHFGLDVNTISGIEQFVDATGFEFELAFEHVDEAAGCLLSVGGRGTCAGGEFDDLSPEPLTLGGCIERDDFDLLGAAFRALEVGFARNGEGVMGGFAEEIAHAHAVDATDGGERGQGRNHAVGFELGKECGGKASFCGEARERESLLVSKRAKLEADAIGFEGPLGIRNRFDHAETPCQGENLGMRMPNQIPVSPLLNMDWVAILKNP